MADPLVLLSVGAVTAVGLSARQTCAAVRAGVPGFRESRFFDATTILEPVIAAACPLGPAPEEDPPFDRLLRMAARALAECIDSEPIDPERTALILGAREPYRDDRGLDQRLAHLLYALQGELGKDFHPQSCVFPLGNAAALRGLRRARNLLVARKVDSCIVGGVDSFLNARDIGRLQQNYRLLNPKVAQGLIPGEGAVFLLVTTRTLAGTRPKLGEILGIGLAEEDQRVTLLSDGHPTGRGLKKALESCVQDAGAEESAVELRVSDLNGEYYRGIESMMAMSRFYRTHRDNLPIWHPADCVGEIGAASGALLVIVAATAIRDGYAPGVLAMCEAASDTGLRAACLVSGGAAAAGKTDRARPGSGAEQEAQWPGARTVDTMPAVIDEVVDQHSEEVAILWGIRDRATGEPHFSLTNLAEFDERVEAHLDGLRHSGGHGWKRCEAGLAAPGPGEVFAAAVIAVEARDPARLERCLEVATTRALARGLVSALGWIPYSRAAEFIGALLDSPVAGRRRTGLAACAVHRKDPAAALVSALGAQEPTLRARALRAAGELGRRDLLPAVTAQLGIEDAECRLWSSWASALLGGREAIIVLREIVDQGSLHSEIAVEVAFRRMEAGVAREWLKDLADHPERVRVALLAAGAIAEPAVIPWLVEQMSNADRARLAGQSFALITGADLELDQLERKVQERIEGGTNENPEREDVEMDPDENLPWPDAAKVEAWWKAHAKGFKSGIRYLLGRPVMGDSLEWALRHGKQRQRAAAALELVFLRPGTPLFEVRAPAYRQRAMLGM